MLCHYRYCIITNPVCVLIFHYTTVSMVLSRPDPYYQSFVLSSGGESEEVYGKFLIWVLGCFVNLYLFNEIPFFFQVCP